MSTKRYLWAAPGDVNAFFGLMLDNIADLLLTVGLLAVVFDFPTNFALRYMVPGTAIGVLVGDLLFFFMALRVARRTGRHDITAMPLGLDTPSTIGMVFFVLGPAFLAAKAQLEVADVDDPNHPLVIEAARQTWHIGICAIVISGVFKMGCAFGSNWIRRVVPRAGLLGSLAAIALVLIAFLPLLEVLHYPVVGLVSLAIILTTLVARVRLPARIPGALGALLVGAAIYYLMLLTNTLPSVPEQTIEAHKALLPYEWLTVFNFQWLGALDDTVKYLPLVIPFALATVVGGIDCTESAAAAGDEFDTNQVIGVEAFATLVAGFCGGVIQTTPYIGHPAYKAMGGRSAYTLATAIFVGGAGLLGYFGYLYLIIPKATVFPILIFIGLEITAQSFHATPKRHYAAVAFACIPALAALAMIFIGDLQGQFGEPIRESNTNVAKYRSLTGDELSAERLDALMERVRDDGQRVIDEGNEREELLSAVDQLEQTIRDYGQQSADASESARIERNRTLRSVESNAEAVITLSADSSDAAVISLRQSIGEFLKWRAFAAIEQQGQRMSATPQGPLKAQIETLRILSNGFIVTSLLWASALAAIIDRRLWTAATYFAIAAGCSLFGVIHSPIPGGPMFLPWQIGQQLAKLNLDAHLAQMPIQYAAGYLAVAILLIAWGWWQNRLTPNNARTEEPQP